MNFFIRSMHMTMLDDGFTERRKLENAVEDAIALALKPIRVKGLGTIDAYWVYPPSKKAPPPEVRDIRYSKKSRALTCRYVFSPAVASNSAEWRAYRVSHVEQVRSMTRDLMEAIQERLTKNGYDGDVIEATKAVSKALTKIRRRYAR